MREAKAERGASRRKGESPAREASTDRKKDASTIRIQDEPESTIGRKPEQVEHPERREHGRHGRPAP